VDGYSKTHIILRREGDADETLSNSEMELNKLKMQRGPCGPGRTIGTVTVRRSNSLQGFTCHKPEAPKHWERYISNESRSRRVKQFLSFIYSNQVVWYTS
jgi:hypothetical protein